MNVVQKAKDLLGLGGSEESAPEPPESADEESEHEAE